MEKNNTLQLPELISTLPRSESIEERRSRRLTFMGSKSTRWATNEPSFIGSVDIRELQGNMYIKGKIKIEDNSNFDVLKDNKLLLSSLRTTLRRINSYIDVCLVQCCTMAAIFKYLIPKLTQFVENLERKHRRLTNQLFSASNFNEDLKKNKVDENWKIGEQGEEQDIVIEKEQDTSDLIINAMLTFSKNANKKKRKNSQNYRDDEFDKSKDNSPTLKLKHSISDQTETSKSSDFHQIKDQNEEIGKKINSTVVKNRKVLELIRKHKAIIEQYLVPLSDGKLYQIFLERIKALKNQLNSQYSYCIQRISDDKNSTPGYKQIPLSIIEYAICQDIKKFRVLVESILVEKIEEINNNLISPYSDLLESIQKNVSRLNELGCTLVTSDYLGVHSHMCIFEMLHPSHQKFVLKKLKIPKHSKGINEDVHDFFQFYIIKYNIKSNLTLGQGLELDYMKDKRKAFLQFDVNFENLKPGFWMDYSFY